jgi:hypothetical protein
MPRYFYLATIPIQVHSVAPLWYQESHNALRYRGDRSVSKAGFSDFDVVPSEQRSPDRNNRLTGNPLITQIEVLGLLS